MSRKSRFAIVPGIGSGQRRRPARVADLIRNEMALLLLSKIKDPRVCNVTITSVTVTNDLRQARIFYSVFDEAAREDAQKGLISAKGFIRSYLAHVLNLRHAPDLEFKEDTTLAAQEKMERIFQEIHNEHDNSST